MASVVILGPAHPLRGGLATYDQRLCRQFLNEGHQCCIYSFSLQYPSFLFPGTTQYSDDPPPENIEIHTVVNSINPFNWIKVGRALKKRKPDIIVVRYWLPIMGPALGSILRLAKKNKHTKVIAITDNIFPHEKRPGDKMFTQYFLNTCDGFVTMSEKVLSDLRSIETSKPAKFVSHPLYDNFGDIISKEVARKELGLTANGRVILFFGFIRKYKGLDILLDAMKMVKNQVAQKHETPVQLLVAGEFYEDDKPYLQQVKDNGIEDIVILRTEFVADSRVKYYLCAADVVVQPYRNATQSGVTPLAYHFEKPMIVTNVGGLTAMVPEGKVGLIAAPEASSIAEKIQEFYSMGEAHFSPGIIEEKKKYTWDNITRSIFDIWQNLK
ncbi:MAG: glycosyltransferase [Agriterribacter sp.]